MIKNTTKNPNNEFDPPYLLRGQVLINFCYCTDSSWILEEKKYLNYDLKLLKLLKYLPVMVISSHWSPHPLHPVPYDEVIVSCFAFRNMKLFSIPIVLYLNDDFHVALGRIHYHLPKLLTPELAVDSETSSFVVRSLRSDIQMQYFHGFLQILLFPVSLLAALAISLATNLVAIVGSTEKPWIVSRIALMPCLSFGKFARPLVFEPGVNATVTPVFSLVWHKTYALIGKPKVFKSINQSSL